VVPIPGELANILVLVLLNGFFAGAELAVISIP
jgi:CBS domain containing-hemolysin-like protein